MSSISNLLPHFTGEAWWSELALTRNSAAQRPLTVDIPATLVSRIRPLLTAPRHDDFQAFESSYERPPGDGIRHLHRQLARVAGQREGPSADRSGLERRQAAG